MSIIDTQRPARRLSFNQKAMIAVLTLVIVLPALISGLIILMILAGGRK